MITPWLVFRLGLSQLVCWGTSYYLIGGFGEEISHTFGWPLTLTYGGFSGALAVMGLSSGLVGRLIDRHGGRFVMAAGSLLLAVGCGVLSLSGGLVSYAIAWFLLGLGMRMTLYDAAFASLARIGGRSARRSMSQITLLGGLASTVFWPFGHMLSQALGWRGAVAVYAVLALLTVPMHLSIPHARHDPDAANAPVPIAPLAQSHGERLLAGGLYLVLVTLTSVLNAGMSAHMIGIMSGLGLTTGLAVWLSTLRGVGQSSARLCEVVFGGRLHPMSLGMLAAALLPLCFLVGLFTGRFVLAGVGFALLYGAGNGLLTIVRGSYPLVLFDNRAYGAIAGRLTAPSFLLGALAPVSYAALIETAGNQAALAVSIVLGGIILACAVWLWARFLPRGKTVDVPQEPAGGPELP